MLHRVQEGRRIAGVARVKLDRKRLARAIGQQAGHHLLFAPLAVPIVAKGRQFIVPALEIHAGHIVKKHRPLGGFGGQSALNLALVRRQILQRGIEIVLIKRAHLQDLAHGVVLAGTGGRQPTALVRQPGVNQVERQPWRASGLADRADDPQLAGHRVQPGQQSVTGPHMHCGCGGRGRGPGG